jgi:SAM-dependent methyltransferase
MIKKLFNRLHEKWANEKFSFFINKMNLSQNDTILDLGGGDGSYMDKFSSSLKPYKILVSDIDPKALKKAREKGYETLIIDASCNQLPYEDQQINCIFCNSVIEHVTLPKDQLWTDNNSTSDFSTKAFEIQKKFASEIMRSGQKYYVQTPHKTFPIEAHTWLPFISYLNRKTQLKVLKIINKYWIKKTEPDWNLLNEDDMKALFPNAEIIVNRKFGFKKEIIAIKR